MRQWSRIHDVYNLKTQRIQRAHSRLTPRTRAGDMNVQIFHAIFFGDSAGLLRSHLRRERRTLARPPKTGRTCACPRKGITLPVGDSDYGVVEGGANMSDSIRNISFDPLSRAT